MTTDEPQAEGNVWAYPSPGLCVADSRWDLGLPALREALRRMPCRATLGVIDMRDARRSPADAGVRLDFHALTPRIVRLGDAPPI